MAPKGVVMPDAGLGGFATRTGFTAGGVYSPGAVAYGRTANDGSYPVVATILYIAARGNGATRSGTAYMGGCSGGFSVGAGSSALDIGWIEATDWLTYGGTAVNYGFTGLSGSTYFPRSANSGPVNTYGQFGNFTGSFGMIYRYVMPAVAPTIVSIVPSVDGTSATVNFSFSGDDGGSGPSGYRIQRARDAAFTVDVVTINAGGTPTIVTGLEPGVTYYYRMTTRNYASDAASKLGGPWSAATSMMQPVPNGTGRIHNGTSFVENAGRIHNGTSWVEASMRVHNGTAWIDGGY